MSFPAPCADSARPPGMLTCRIDLLSLMKKSGKVFVTLFPRSAPPWPATLWRQVFDAIKIATSLLVCFLQRRFHHRWLLQGAVFTKKTDLKRSRSSASVLSHNTATAPHRVQAIISKSCSSRSRFSLFRHGHPNGWFTTTGRQPSPNPHLAVTALSESPSRRVCLQARSPLKKSSLCGGYIIIEESILQQPSLFAGLADTSLEPATTQA